MSWGWEGEGAGRRRALLAPRQTEAPAAWRALAMASPIPLLAPVTTHTFPAMGLAASAIVAVRW